MPFAFREISGWLQSIHKHKNEHRTVFVHSAVFVAKIHIITTLLWHACSQFQPIAKFEIISNNQYQDQTLKFEMRYRHVQKIVVKKWTLAQRAKTLGRLHLMSGNHTHANVQNLDYSPCTIVPKIVNQNGNNTSKHALNACRWQVAHFLTMVGNYTAGRCQVCVQFPSLKW